MSNHETLEKIVDQQGLRETLLMLASICYDKDNHILTNWQDPALAKQWKDCGNLLLTTFMPLYKTPT